jgi:hypothetical protein
MDYTKRDYIDDKGRRMRVTKMFAEYYFVMVGNKSICNNELPHTATLQECQKNLDRYAMKYRLEEAC